MTRTSSVIAAVMTAVVAGAWGHSGAAQSPRQIPPGDWPNLNRDLAATRYSPLTEINTTNVSSLKRAWTFKLGGGTTSVPLVVNGMMYVSSGPRVVPKGDVPTRMVLADAAFPGASRSAQSRELQS